jgi:beta-lactamase class A
VKLNRRSALSFGGVAAATAIGATAVGQANAAPAPKAAPNSKDPVAQVGAVYASEVAKAQGTWSSLITVGAATAVDSDADTVVEAYSVNKLGVATAVLDKIDRGLLTLDQRVDVTADIVIQDIDGIFALDGAYPSSITLGHMMANLLSVSDNTAARLCGLVCPPREINQILLDKGFVHTQVVPGVINPNRFYLGQTTARETHTLLSKLVAGELLSPSSTAYLLNVIRSTSAFSDGIRLNLTTPERLRVGTKAGWEDDGRNEAGVVFAADGTPGAIYSLFASGTYAGDKAVNDADFGAPHPALRARQALGRKLFDVVDTDPTIPSAKKALPKYPTPPIHHTNGG